MLSGLRNRAKKAGKPPGSLMYTGDRNTPPVITVITYAANDFTETVVKNFSELTKVLKPDETTWINVEGLNDLAFIKELTQHYGIHPLTTEDILNTDQRPKVEEFENYLFITFKVILWPEKTPTFSIRQVSLVLGENFILSFQELDTTLFDPLRKRLANNANQQLRKQGADYLAYRLIDAVVDEYFVVLESLGDSIEATESLIISEPSPQQPRIIYRLKRQMIMLRRAIWPMREAISHLIHDEGEIIKRENLLYLRDVYDHVVQVIDTVEIFRDMLSGMLDMYLSSLTNRMNEIMKTLTIIATIFIPITCIASIYGMNFKYMPGLEWRWGYETIMGIMVGIGLIMIFYFYKKKWL